MDDLTRSIRTDFDRIARLPEPRWTQNLHYHDFVLDQLPERAGSALDLGCGAGRLTRRLAARCRRVLAIDSSREMIREARQGSQDCGNVDYCVADIRDFALPPGYFDFIQSVATLHHVPFRETLIALEASLKPGGTLVILDLPEWRTPGNYLISCVAVPFLLAQRFRHNGSIREDPALRAAYLAHMQHDRFLRLREIKKLCRSLLPGARIRRHLLWRYSIVWMKQGYCR